MITRAHILDEINRLASLSDGQPPGQKLFTRETGIKPGQWLGKFWARWGDALEEAGFSPNQWNSKLESNAVLAAIINACRHYGHLPTKSEFQLFRSIDPALPTPAAIQRHFGARSELIATLAKRAAEDASFADIAAMLPSASPPIAQRSTKVREGFVYLIRSGGFCKIGRSDDLERRVKQITVALPDKAELLHSIRTDDPVGIEAYWHRRFADRRANGEWFKLSSQDVAAFRKRKFQ